MSRADQLAATDELITAVAAGPPTVESIHALAQRHGAWQACTALLVRWAWRNDIETPTPPRVCEKGGLPWGSR